MNEKLQLNHSWLVAVWPGMGHVALNAGWYLLSKLGMEVMAELEATGLFDVDHVEVKGGIVRPGHPPRNRFFVWTDPAKKHDLLVFLGEAQPPVGKYDFCREVIAYARKLGVERLFTFAAMATQMHPERESRVFAVGTDEKSLEELKQLGLEPLEDGHIGGLNGVLLGVGAENGLSGACLLGEMPHIFAQLPFPKASLAILEVFVKLAGIELDLAELTEQIRVTEERLGELLAEVEQSHGEQELVEEGFTTEAEEEEEHLSAVDRQRIEGLFGQAVSDRSKAFELKQELDRLGVFKEYEDRFLDLFKKAG